jgi:hypothetical protein
LEKEETDRAFTQLDQPESRATVEQHDQDHPPGDVGQVDSFSP